MKSLDFSRYALISCVAAAMLAACGGSQPPIGAPGAMPQASAIRSARRAWQVVDAAGGKVRRPAVRFTDSPAIYVFSYPKAKLVGRPQWILQGS